MSDSCFSCKNYNNTLGYCLLSAGCEFTPKTLGDSITESGFLYHKEKAKTVVKPAMGRRNKEEEKKYLDKLVNDHWAYIEGVLYQALQYTGEATDSDTARIEEVEYHYKTAFKHGWGHCREYHVGETL